MREIRGAKTMLASVVVTWRCDNGMARVSWVPVHTLAWCLLGILYQIPACCSSRQARDCGPGAEHRLGIQRALKEGFKHPEHHVVCMVRQRAHASTTGPRANILCLRIMASIPWDAGRTSWISRARIETDDLTGVASERVGTIVELAHHPVFLTINDEHWSPARR